MELINTVEPTIQGRYIFERKDFINIAKSLDNAKIRDQIKFNVLCSLISDSFIYPYPYNFINNKDIKIPSFVDEKVMKDLFELGYRPSPKQFYFALDSVKFFEFAPLYCRYVGLPWAPEEVIALNENNFVPYVHHSLFDIIKDIVDQAYNSGMFGFSDGTKTGLKILHSLYNLESDFKKGIFSFSRVNLPNLKCRVIFKLLDVPEEKNIKPGSIFIKPGKMKIKLLYFDEPISELLSLKDIISSEDWNQYIFYRVVDGDYSVDIDTVNFKLIDFIKSPTFYGTPLEYILMKGSKDAISRLEDHGLQEEEKKTKGLEEKIKEVVEDVFNKDNKEYINAITHRYQRLYGFSLSFDSSSNILSLAFDSSIIYLSTLKNKIKVIEFRGNLDTLVSLKDLFEYEQPLYYTKIFILLLNKDNSVSLNDLIKRHGYNINFPIIYTVASDGTYLGSPLEICAYFGFTELANRLALLKPNCLSNGLFAKAVLNGKYKKNRYNFSFEVNEEDLGRYNYSLRQ
jgi:hypothetical protein